MSGASPDDAVAMSYLAALTLKLAAGVESLPEDVRGPCARFFTARQNADGGFSGRQGGSDLYYGSFGLRGLALLGELTEDRARLAAGYLNSQWDRRATLGSVEFLSLVTSALLIEAATGIAAFPKDRSPLALVLEHVGPLQRDDGGYARTAKSPHSSTYHTFLVASCLELLGSPLRDPVKTAACVRARQRPDGGFVELPQLAQGGVNPTAAAVGLLSMTAGLDADTANRAAEFLRANQTEEGGFRANGRIPFADLLSTFTALVALADLKALDRIDAAAARRYAQRLAHDGGFRGGAWDDAADVEYAFYGLGVLAI